MTQQPDITTIDDKLDAISLVRARLAGDTPVMRALINTAGQGMYVALLDLTAGLAIVQGGTDPDHYLTELAATVRADRNPEGTK